MTGKYAAEWADALGDVAEAGAPISFAAAGGATVDFGTDTSSGAAAAAITGQAIRVKGDPQKYLALGLIESRAPTLFFVADAYGALPSLGMVGTWGTVPYTVEDISPIDLDGKGAIAARIIVKA